MVVRMKGSYLPRCVITEVEPTTSFHPTRLWSGLSCIYLGQEESFKVFLITSCTSCTNLQQGELLRFFPCNKIMEWFVIYLSRTGGVVELYAMYASTAGGVV